MKQRKVYILTTTILLLCVLSTGCIPDSQNIPIPTNTFDVNINIDAGANDTTNKTMIIDGDTIIFGLWSIVWYGVEIEFMLTTNAPGFEILNIKHDGFNLYTNTYDTTHYYADASNANTLDSGIVINDSYNTYPWLPFISYAGRYYNPVSSKLFQFNYDGYEYLTQGMPRNKNQYIVLRKLIGTSYQYYWIRVRNDDSASLVVTAGDCRINSKILNGRYQLNSITTGQ